MPTRIFSVNFSNATGSGDADFGGEAFSHARQAEGGRSTTFLLNEKVSVKTLTNV